MVGHGQGYFSWWLADLFRSRHRTVALELGQLGSLRRNNLPVVGRQPDIGEGLSGQIGEMRLQRHRGWRLGPEQLTSPKKSKGMDTPVGLDPKSTGDASANQDALSILE